uniref:Uncharacterized protein n=1 Tax=Odontella aurita TaxID=265563 RepID=A0A7S4NIE4_9STRA|mmetsp:Transcript_9003/g.26896  ORF Transcript_9003/g.26896 Transcript_9003/m.26896 type:complete len:644 (+) Transcript_9003:225-2156(+)
MVFVQATSPADAGAGAGFTPKNWDRHSNYSQHEGFGESSIDATGQEEQQRERAALAYLLRYEAMVRQQDAEDMATSAHLGPIWGRLAEMGAAKGGEIGEDGNGTAAAASAVDSVLSRDDMRRALLWLEAQTAEVDREGSTEAMTTDLQLMFLLRTLACDQRKTVQEDGRANAVLTFPEFSFAYKLVVGGMQCLQMLPPASEGEPEASELRGRVTDRTTSMLQSFYKGRTFQGEAVEDESAHSTQKIKAKKLAAAVRASTKQLNCAPESDDVTAATAKGNDTVSDGTTFSGGGSDEMRRLLTVKDRQLVRILDDHFDEMDNVAGRIADKALADKKNQIKRFILAAGVLASATLVWGGSTMTTMGQDSSETGAVNFDCGMGDHAVVLPLWQRINLKKECGTAKKGMEEVVSEAMGHDRSDSEKEGNKDNNSSMNHMPLKNLQSSLAGSILKAQVQDTVETKEKQSSLDEYTEKVKSGRQKKSEGGAKQHAKENALHQQIWGEEESRRKNSKHEKSAIESNEEKKADDMVLRSARDAKYQLQSKGRNVLRAKKPAYASNPRGLLLHSTSMDVWATLGLNQFLKVDPSLPEEVFHRRTERRRSLLAITVGAGAALLVPALGSAVAPLLVGLMGFGWIRTLLAKSGSS